MIFDVDGLGAQGGGASKKLVHDEPSRGDHKDENIAKFGDSHLLPVVLVVYTADHHTKTSTSS